MKRTLLATAILVLLLPGAYAGARDHTYQIKPGLTAVVTVSGQNRHTVSARVGKGPVQQLAVMDDEAVDVFETPDIDHDGYADLAIGQSGGGTQARMRLFLYRPNEGRYQEIRHPAPEASPCHGFVNPVFDAGKPAFSTGCRYSADSQGEESYAVRPDGTAVPVSWITQIWFPQASAKVEARYEFHGDGTVARILLDGEGSPFDGGDNVAPSTASISMTRPTSRAAHRRSCAPASGMTWWRCGRRAGCKCACPGRKTPRRSSGCAMSIW